MAISPPAPLAGAPLSRRLADTQSSPVRELLEHAMQPHIISLAGGLPAPDTFDVAGLRAAFDEVLSGPAARSARCSTRRPRATRRYASGSRRSCRTRGLDVDGRRPADHDRLAAGAGPRRLRAYWTRATRSWSRTRPTSRRCRPSSSPTCARIAIPGDDDGPDPDALIERGPRDRRQGRLPDPDLPEPDRPHDRRRAPRRAGRGRRRRRACGWSRTTRTARCAWTARTSTCWPPSPPRATARSSSRRCRRCSRPACGSATCARPPRCAGR